ncbi:MAG: thiolase family protein [Anaerolineaceae bacterium]|nr:thiolase family protein [Anaerolineaceae bacterium]
MSEVVIVEAVRSPIGRRNGWLREIHPVTLGALTLNELLARGGATPQDVDHVVMGCVEQADEQGLNVARNIVLEAEWPIEIAATSVDFQCGSSQQAVHLGAAMVAAGQAQVVVAGGVEHMTRVPMGSTVREASPFTPGMMDVHQLVHQGIASDEIARHFGIQRDEIDDYSYESHLRAARATERGWLTGEMFEMEGVDAAGQTIRVKRDEGFRAAPDRERMSQLPPAFTEDGVTTAGNSSQISDGAAAILLTTREHAAKKGWRPRARILATCAVGSDPHLMLTGPLPATHQVLQRAGLQFSDIDLFEVNEAFATVVKAWEQEFQPDRARVNVHGGAVAIGHPLGGSGARLMTTLVHALTTHDRQLGLQTMCCGGGMATATIVERLN